MSQMVQHLLPSLEALGLYSYWIVGGAAMLEAFFVTGVFIPGTLIVDAGGVLVQRGAIDFIDLVWFVAIGSFLGGELGYWLGVLARRGMNTRWRPENSPRFERASDLFATYGGMALILGRFAGPVAGLVPFAASVAGMPRRRFAIWNAASGVPYALAHVSLGYFLGDVSSRFGPAATRMALFAGAVIFVLALVLWLVVRIERMLPFVWSILRSVAQGIAEAPEVRAWSTRHPGVSGFVAGRLDASRFWGLTATLIGAAFVYVLLVWVGSVLDFLMAEPVLQADLRLANLMHAFWSPALLRGFAHVTALGDWRVLMALAVAAIAWLWVRRRPELVLALGVSFVGSIGTVMVLKRLFHRPRPELAYFVETSGSFPSAHAAISVAFYGMLFYIAWRIGRLGPLVAGLLAATVAFLIGLSRLYLVEHYLTDVINGWLVGALWLLIGIAISEWKVAQQDGQPTMPGGRARLAIGALALGLCALAGWQIATYDKARNVAATVRSDETAQDVPALLQNGRVPTLTESVAGSPLEPVNVVILAADESDIVEAMRRAGWRKAERPTLGSLAQAAWAELTNAADVRAPVTPYFWDGKPTDFAFQKPTPDNTVRQRHHVRFWRTRFVTEGGLRLFVGAASFDDGLDWQFLHHIDPNIDAERDQVVADLGAAGDLPQQQDVRLSRPRLGESIAGDPWFTDGNAVLIELGPQAAGPTGN